MVVMFPARMAKPSFPDPHLDAEGCGGAGVAAAADTWKGSRMQFGLFYEAPEDRRYTHAQRYEEMLALMAYGEALGFDVVWMAEIHFGGAFSLLSVPLMILPVIAQRTRRIRIGTAVTLLPLAHPLSCAEQAATADVLSRGRLEFGVGRAGHAWQPDQMALMLPVHVGATGEAAKLAMRGGVEKYYRNLEAIFAAV